MYMCMWVGLHTHAKLMIVAISILLIHVLSYMYLNWSPRPKSGPQTVYKNKWSPELSAAEHVVPPDY